MICEGNLFIVIYTNLQIMLILNLIIPCLTGHCLILIIVYDLAPTYIVTYIYLIYVFNLIPWLPKFHIVYMCATKFSYFAICIYIYIAKQHKC